MSVNLVKLTQVAEINPRFKNGPPERDEEVAFVPMSAVSAETASIEVPETRLLSTVLTGFTYFQGGDVLIAKITPCFENGKIAQARISQRHGFGSTEFHVIRANESQLDARYLLHFLRQPAIRIDGERKMTGSAGQRRVPKHFVEDLDIPLLPLTEQQRIAAILDQTESLRGKRRRALTKLDTLTQSLFLDLFGNSRNPHQWPVVGLGEFFHFTTGKLDSNAAVADGAYPFFTCSRDDFRIDHYAFDCEALLLAGNNATADYSVKHYRGKFNAYQRTYVITLKNAEHSYLYAKVALERKLSEMKRFSKGSNTKYLTLGILKNIQIQVPPIELQREFERQAAIMEGLERTQHVSLSKLDSLFASLQHRAFRGEL